MSRILYIFREAGKRKETPGMDVPWNWPGTKINPAELLPKNNPLSFGPSVSGTKALPAQPGTVCLRNGFC